MLHRLYRVLCSALVAAGLLSLLTGAVLAQSPRSVLVAPVNGIINPVQADYVKRVIDQAERTGAAAVVLQVNTPGGLDTSMRQIIQRILAAEVPVIVWVGPPGARAGSAGVYITYAAHLAAMAPNTNIGSATPVAMGEGGEVQMSDEMRAKINNDAAAYIRSLAEQRDRNAEWAERAVREGVNVSVNEAVQQNIVNLLAADIPQLLEQVDGRTVETARGPVTLATAGASIERIEMNPLEQLLHAISDPTIAYILLSLGTLGLMLELYNPGSLLPGIVGGIALLLAFYALGTLPVNYAGLLLMGFAILLFVAEFFSPTSGMLSVGGVIAFVLGSLLLFNAPDGASFLQVSVPVIAAVTLLFAGFFMFVVGAVLRGRRRKAVTGREGLVGQVADVRRRLDPKGFVHLEGELWRAEATGRAVEVGEQVRVLGMTGLLLRVEPLQAVAPAHPSPSESAQPAPSEPRAEAAPAQAGEQPPTSREAAVPPAPTR